VSERLNMKIHLGNYFIQKLRALNSLAVFYTLSFCVTAGCASLGTVVVGFDLDVEVAERDPDGRALRTGKDEIIKQPRNSKTAPTFSDVRYQGKVLMWETGATFDGFGYAIQSQVSGSVCLRFDQARLTSNMQEKEVAMRVSRVRQGPPQSPTIQIPQNRNEIGFFVAPQLCFSREKIDNFFLAPDLSALFPSGKMFNVSWSGNAPNLLEHGIGNWLKIHVPVEYEGKRQEFEVTLTAKDSKAWLGKW
jgi:hypothetical protein